jgi:hypothetical protein
MWLKHTVIFLLFISVALAQNDSLFKEKNPNSDNKPNNYLLAGKYVVSYSKYNAYVFLDVVRLVGLGAEYRPASFFAADVKIGVVYPHGIMASNILANDYFYNTGAGLILTPKFYPGVRKIMYVGFNLGFYDYGYKKQWAESGIEYDQYNPDKELRNRQTLSVTFGPTLGFTGNTERNNIELFLSLGAEATYNKITAYDGTKQGMKITSPYSYTANGGQINVLAGLKFGFGFNRKQYYAKRYYVSLFCKLIYNDDRFVRQTYSSDRKVFRDRLQEYYSLKNEQLDAIKQLYNKSPNDMAALNNAVKVAQKNMVEFIDKHFRNKNFEYHP